MAGTLEQKRDGWTWRVHVHGRRVRFLFPHCHTKKQAEQRRDDLTLLRSQMRRHPDTMHWLTAAAQAPPDELAGVLTRALRARDRSSAPTFREIAEDWTSGRLHQLHPDHVRAKRSAHSDVTRLETYVYPVIGDRVITSLTIDDCEAVMAGIPAHRSTATRRHVGQVMARVFNMAVYPLRVLTVSPMAKGFLPAVRRTKAVTYLYPSEDAALMRCRDVPLEFRVFWGLLAREGLRAGEACQLAWSDLDLKRGAVRLDANKSDDPRAWALDPGVTRALTAWQRLSGSLCGPDVERQHSNNTLPKALRRHLRAAGVTRSELYESSSIRQPIRAHDLRGTFVTVSLAQGRSEHWVTDRTGHRSSAMLARYKRAARTLAELGEGPLKPLDRAIGPELGPGSRKRRRKRAI